MKTREILTADEASLAPKLRELKLKELERHAEKIVEQAKLGDYPTLIGCVIKMTPGLHGQKEPMQRTRFVG